MAAPRRRRVIVLSLVIVSALVLALAASGAIIASRVLGWGGSSGGLGVVDDLRKAPSEAWNYSFRNPRVPDLMMAGDFMIDEEDIVLLLASEGDPRSSQVARVDGGDGTEAWSVSLDSLGFPVGNAPMLLPLSPEGHLSIATNLYDEEDGLSLWITSLDPATGEIVSSAVREGDLLTGAGMWRSQPYITSRDGKNTSYALPVIVGTDEGTARLDTADLAGDPLWEKNTAPIYVADLHAGLVSAETDTGEIWLDAETGQVPGWYEDGGFDGEYRPAFEPHVLRLEYIDGEFFELEGVDDRGVVQWSAEIATPLQVRTSDGTALLSAEVASSDSDGYYEYLMRIDPATGEEMWESEYRDTFSSLGTQVIGGQLAVVQGSDTLLLDAATGEETHRLRGAAKGFGTGVLYTVDEHSLRAWDVRSGSELWSSRLGKGIDIQFAGAMLIVIDYDRGEISRLR